MTPFDHSLIRRSFHCHAGEYDARVVVQRRVTARLAASLRQSGLSPRRIVDIGCGTGTLLAEIATLFPDAALTGLDLAPGMLAAAAAKLGSSERLSLVEGDAEQLPFAAATFDLAVSTSTYQWVDDLTAAFAQVRRVLVPGGEFRFALFGEGTLKELRESYAAAEERCGFVPGARTHRFRPAAAVSRALVDAGFADCFVHAEDEVEWYRTVPDLLRGVRGAGAGTPAAPVSRGLGERRVMLAMMEIYRERFADPEGVRATYEVIYGRGRRER